ncbi:MAG: polysaccharide biosynthesis tyrosine autokinase [Crinalium sp.]
MNSRESLDLDLSNYLLGWKRRWVAAVSVFSATVTLSILSTTLIKPSYEAQGQILFKVPTFNIVSSEGSETGELRSVVSSQNPINTQIEIISSPSVLKRTIDELNLQNNQGQPVKARDIKKDLTIKIIPGTDVIQITYKSKTAEQAPAVVNKVMELYIRNIIINNQWEAKQAVSLINKKLPEVEDNFRSAQVDIRKFKEQNNIVDLSEEAQASVEILTNLDNQIGDVQGELAQVSAQANELRQKVALSEQEALTVSAISQSQAVQEVIKQLQEINTQLANESIRFSEEAPVIISLQAKKANLQSLLQQEIQKTIGNATPVPQGILQVGNLKQSLIEEFLRSEVQRQGLAEKLASLYNTRSAYAQRAKILPQLLQNQFLLEQKAETTQATYKNLLKKLEEVQLAATKNASNAQIIAPAIVAYVIKGKKLLVVVLGVMLGAFLSVAIVLFLEIRDRSLKTLQEIIAIFPYTVLGIIPLYNQYNRSRNQAIADPSKSIIVRDDIECLTSELYRMIQANIKFLSSDQQIKSIVVTSSVPQEGKSTVAANLGAAIAQLGRKVLLIDADMRLASQHYLWQLTNVEGLSEVLVGQANFSTALYNVMDNLDVVTAGVRPLNPLALLDSKRMNALINELSHQYDLVIIDSPPLLVAADALTLSQMTDGILLVARPEVIDATAAKASQEILARSDQKVLGMVINGIIEPHEPSSYFFHTKAYFSESNRETKVNQLNSSGL